METTLKILYLILISTIISFFVALLIKTTMFLLKLFSKTKNKNRNEQHFSAQNIEKLQKDAGGTNEELETEAVIGLALHMYLNEQDDYEKLKLTIHKIVKPYSPWSSKIYGLRNYHK
ncbi:MAG: hypothetical protein V1773_10305 [bacterium]